MNWFFCFLISMLPVAAAAQRNLNVQPADGQRVALVIGNAAYQQGALKNPVNDVRAIAERLQRLGFVVIKRENMKAKEMGGALREFRSRLSAGAVALFFYAGHGLQVKGVNYLPAVDADIEAEEDVYAQALNVNNVLELMEEAKTRVNLVFLDACRNNPFSRKFRSAAGGLAKLDAASGTLISFATRPGSVAADGDGRNGLYTEHLLKHMEEPGLPIEQVLKRTGAGVKLASKGRQEPWSEGLIEGEFYFRAATQTAAPFSAPAAPPPDPATLELALWESVKDSRSSDELNAYLEQYPSGRFAAVARARLKTLAAAPAVSAPPQQLAYAAPTARVEAISYVNGRPVPKSAFEVLVRLKLSSTGRTEDANARNQLKTELINREIVSQRAAAKGIGRYPDWANIQRPADIEAYLALQEVLVNNYMREYLKDHPATDEAMRKEYERVRLTTGDREYHAAHILVSTESEARKIIDRLRNGENFEALAKQSADVGSRDRGGDLEWNTPAVFVKEFSDAMVRLSPGSFSNAPVQSKFGWHVIKLFGTRPVQFPSYESVKDRIRQQLTQSAIDQHLRELRAEAKIVD